MSTQPDVPPFDYDAPLPIFPRLPGAFVGTSRTPLPRPHRHREVGAVFVSRSVRGPDYRSVKLGLHGWYVDGEPATEQRAYEILDHQEETQRSKTE